MSTRHKNNIDIIRVRKSAPALYHDANQLNFPTFIQFVYFSIFRFDGNSFAAKRFVVVSTGNWILQRTEKYATKTKSQKICNRMHNF